MKMLFKLFPFINRRFSPFFKDVVFCAPIEYFDVFMCSLYLYCYIEVLTSTVSSFRFTYFIFLRKNSILSVLFKPFSPLASYLSCPLKNLNELYFFKAVSVLGTVVVFNCYTLTRIFF